MSLLCLILAGGKSIRMGEDKALINDSVNELSKKLVTRNCRVIVACGSKERSQLFKSECWPDPPESKSLGEVLHAFLQEFTDEVQLFPCDMYELDDEAIDIILAQSPGVPVDVEGREQFTLTRIPRDYNPSISLSLKRLFSELGRNEMAFLGRRLENFNFPNQIDGRNKSNQ
jgi:molybdopterin-guanine dinucleotide biosynthesis protein A